MKSVYVTGLHHFDLQQIMDSGQCFRIRELPIFDANGAAKRHSIVHENHHVMIDTLNTPGSFILYCSQQEFEDVWFPYFNLDVDYYRMVKDILKTRSDPFLEAALKYGSGIRILRQGLFETLLCFMISQNNNITRITKSFNALCERYGERKFDNGVEYYTSPDISKMFGGDFSGLGLGYREAYFKEMFDPKRRDEFENWFSTLKESKAPISKELLIQAKGIGNKVADCICLYGLHQMESYPIDTWMKKIVNVVYGGHFDTTPYSECAGYVQQLQFYYCRSHPYTYNLNE